MDLTWQPVHSFMKNGTNKYEFKYIKMKTCLGVKHYLFYQCTDVLLVLHVFGYRAVLWSTIARVKITR